MIIPIENYKDLAQAIVVSELQEYADCYTKSLKCTQKKKKYYANRLANFRDTIINYSFAVYLDIDMEYVLNEIENRIRKGEKIKWTRAKTQ